MIILSIPFRKPDQIAKVHKLYEKKIEWQEFRLDYSDKPQNLPDNIITSHTVLTYRDKSEGGQGNINFQDKLKWLTGIVRKYNCLLDVEIKLYKVHNLPAENLILSFHSKPSFLKRYTT